MQFLASEMSPRNYEKKDTLLISVESNSEKEFEGEQEGKEKLGGGKGLVMTPKFDLRASGKIGEVQESSRGSKQGKIMKIDEKLTSN